MKERRATIHHPRVHLAVLVKVIHASCQRRYAERHLFPRSNIPGNVPNFHSSYRPIPRLGILQPKIAGP